ncbi:MAG: hypothetical protein AB1704_39620 [Pseudomonadota bacterium]|jgi:hypothetical protein|uniref:DUF7079 family protein n=1 Tax=Burkholderiaceae TaxID=119060 RepID=UPI0010F6F142|nr:hypothetical protein [Burkholderia sp. 4M9327F10]
MGDSITGEDREFVWIFLADAFAGIELQGDGIAKLKKFPIEEIRRIFFDEISVACAFNLYITTPEMDGFDPRWVKAEISRILSERDASIFGRISYQSRALVCKCISRDVWKDVKKSLGT